MTRRSFLRTLAWAAPAVLVSCGGSVAPPSSAPSSSPSPSAASASISAPPAAKPSLSGAASVAASASAPSSAAAGQFKSADDILAALKPFAGKTVNFWPLTSQTLSDDQIKTIEQKSGVKLAVTPVPPTEAFQKIFLDLN